MFNIRKIKMKYLFLALALLFATSATAQETMIPLPRTGGEYTTNWLDQNALETEILLEQQQLILEVIQTDLSGTVIAPLGSLQPIDPGAEITVVFSLPVEPHNTRYVRGYVCWVLDPENCSPLNLEVGVIRHQPGGPKMRKLSLLKVLEMTIPGFTRYPKQMAQLKMLTVTISEKE